MNTSSITIPDTSNDAAVVLDRVDWLCLEGLCMQAYEAGRALGPIEAWPGLRGRLLAGRLAMHLGAPRLARILLRLAQRDSPADPEACYFAARVRLERPGPLGS
jgi:hypothetical protein